MSNNIMVDLETFGKTPGHVIAAIGAVRFTQYGITDEFYTAVNLQSCVDVGLKFDPETVLWWLEQSDEARKRLYAPRRKALPLAEALLAFGDWIGPDPVLWGNGANFDNPFLEVAYEAIGSECPWPFWNDKCYRTIRGLWKHEKTKPVLPHHALYDARAQAETLIQIAKDHPEARIL